MFTYVYGAGLAGIGAAMVAAAIAVCLLAKREFQRAGEKHAGFLIETYGKECVNRAKSRPPQEKRSSVLGGKEVAE